MADVSKGKRSIGRRSSILKTALADIDINVKEKTESKKRVSKRVSFSETCCVKEFARDSPQFLKEQELKDGNSSESDAQLDPHSATVEAFLPKSEIVPEAKRDRLGLAVSVLEEEETTFVCSMSTGLTGYYESTSNLDRFDNCIFGEAKGLDLSEITNLDNTVFVSGPSPQHSDPSRQVRQRQLLQTVSQESACPAPASTAAEAAEDQLFERTVHFEEDGGTMELSTNMDDIKDPESAAFPPRISAPDFLTKFVGLGCTGMPQTTGSACQVFPTMSHAVTGDRTVIFNDKDIPVDESITCDVSSLNKNTSKQPQVSAKSFLASMRGDPPVQTCITKTQIKDSNSKTFNPSGIQQTVSAKSFLALMRGNKPNEDSSMMNPKDAVSEKTCELGLVSSKVSCSLSEEFVNQSSNGRSGSAVSALCNTGKESSNFTQGEERTMLFAAGDRDGCSMELTQNLPMKANSGTKLQPASELVPAETTVIFCNMNTSDSMDITHNSSPLNSNSCLRPALLVSSCSVSAYGDRTGSTVTQPLACPLVPSALKPAALSHAESQGSAGFDLEQKEGDITVTMEMTGCIIESAPGSTFRLPSSNKLAGVWGQTNKNTSKQPQVSAKSFLASMRGDPPVQTCITKTQIKDSNSKTFNPSGIQQTVSAKSFLALMRGNKPNEDSSMINPKDAVSEKTCELGLVSSKVSCSLSEEFVNQSSNGRSGSAVSALCNTGKESSNFTQGEERTMLFAAGDRDGCSMELTQNLPMKANSGTKLQPASELVPAETTVIFCNMNTSDSMDITHNSSPLNSNSCLRPALLVSSCSVSAYGDRTGSTVTQPLACPLVPSALKPAAWSHVESQGSAGFDLEQKEGDITVTMEMTGCIIETAPGSSFRLPSSNKLAGVWGQTNSLQTPISLSFDSKACYAHPGNLSTIDELSHSHIKSASRSALVDITDYLSTSIVPCPQTSLPPTKAPERPKGNVKTKSVSGAAACMTDTSRFGVVKDRPVNVPLETVSKTCSTRTPFMPLSQTGPAPSVQAIDVCKAPLMELLLQAAAPNSDQEAANMNRNSYTCVDNSAEANSLEKAYIFSMEEVVANMSMTACSDSPVAIRNMPAGSDSPWLENQPLVKKTVKDTTAPNMGITSCQDITAQGLFQNVSFDQKDMECQPESRAVHVKPLTFSGQSILAPRCLDYIANTSQFQKAPSCEKSVIFAPDATAANMNFTACLDMLPLQNLTALKTTVMFPPESTLANMSLTACLGHPDSKEQLQSAPSHEKSITVNTETTSTATLSITGCADQPILGKMPEKAAVFGLETAAANLSLTVCSSNLVSYGKFQKAFKSAKTIVFDAETSAANMSLTQLTEQPESFALLDRPTISAVNKSEVVAPDTAVVLTADNLTPLGQWQDSFSYDKNGAPEGSVQVDKNLTDHGAGEQKLFRDTTGIPSSLATDVIMASEEEPNKGRCNPTRIEEFTDIITDFQNRLYNQVCSDKRVETASTLEMSQPVEPRQQVLPRLAVVEPRPLKFASFSASSGAGKQCQLANANKCGQTVPAFCQQISASKAFTDISATSFAVKRPNKGSSDDYPVFKMSCLDSENEVNFEAGNFVSPTEGVSVISSSLTSNVPSSLSSQSSYSERSSSTSSSRSSSDQDILRETMPDVFPPVNMSAAGFASASVSMSLTSSSLLDPERQGASDTENAFIRACKQMGIQSYELIGRAVRRSSSAFQPEFPCETLEDKLNVVLLTQEELAVEKELFHQMTSVLQKERTLSKDLQEQALQQIAHLGLIEEARKSDSVRKQVRRLLEAGKAHAHLVWKKHKIHSLNALCQKFKGHYQTMLEDTADITSCLENLVLMTGKANAEADLLESRVDSLRHRPVAGSKTTRITRLKEQLQQNQTELTSLKEQVEKSKLQLAALDQQLIETQMEKKKAKEYCEENKQLKLQLALSYEKMVTLHGLHSWRLIEQDNEQELCFLLLSGAVHLKVSLSGPLSTRQAIVGISAASRIAEDRDKMAELAAQLVVEAVNENIPHFVATFNTRSQLPRLLEEVSTIVENTKNLFAEIECAKMKYRITLEEKRMRVELWSIKWLRKVILTTNIPTDSYPANQLVWAVEIVMGDLSVLDVQKTIQMIGGGRSHLTKVLKAVHCQIQETPPHL